MTATDVIPDSEGKHLNTQLNKEQLLAHLKEDLAKYEMVLKSNDTLRDDQLVELFNISSFNNLELISEIKKLTSDKFNAVIDIENRTSEQLVELETELSKYLSKLEALQTRMDVKLDNLVSERDNLFVKCQLLLDELE